MKSILLTLLMVLAFPGCAAPLKDLTAEEEKALEAQGAGALAAGDYGKLVELAMPRARAGDPEFQFTVGFMMLEWLEDPKPKEPPTHSARDALVWIYKAVEAGVPQAASTLRDGYEWGRFSLPKNEELEACWRKVEGEEQKPDACLAAEAKLRQQQ